jgi:hypothetical protein
MLIVHVLYIFNINRKEAVYIVFLGYMFAFNLNFNIVKLARIPFVNTLLVLFRCFRLWATPRLWRVRRPFFVIFFIIIELEL